MYSTDPMGSFSSDQFQLSRRNPDNCTCQNSMLHLPVTSKHTSLFWKELPYLPCYFSLSLFFHNEGRLSPLEFMASWFIDFKASQQKKLREELWLVQARSHAHTWANHCEKKGLWLVWFGSHAHCVTRGVSFWPDFQLPALTYISE